MENNDVDAGPEPAGRRRSSRYPGFSLGDAEELSRIVFRLGGKHVQQEAVAQQLGYSNVMSGSFKTRRAAASYFGMVSYAGFDYITVADEWLSAFHNENEDDLARVRREAFLKPELYRLLFEEFKGKMLPHAEKLARHLFLNDRFGIRQDAASSAAEAFLRSAEFAGYLDTRGFLADPAAAPKESTPRSPAADPEKREVPEPATRGTSGLPEMGSNEDRIEIRLGGGRKVFLVIPSPGTLSKSEKDRVKGFVDLVLETPDAVA